MTKSPRLNGLHNYVAGYHGFEDDVPMNILTSRIWVFVAAFSLVSSLPVAALDLQARGRVEQVFVLGAHPKDHISLIDRQGTVIRQTDADGLGGAVFRNIIPDTGYVVVVSGKGQKWCSGPLTVRSRDAVPPWEWYEQQVLETGVYGHAGYGYLETRDGTLLSVQVQLPAGPGPYPTLVEYSGYSPSDATADDIGRGRIQPLRLIAATQGYAYVGVNIRGTGCSGGAFDYFERLQVLDGYDVIETVAAQPWALNHRVGMFGISYPGISQLFVAQSRPPHLAAIAPLSVIDDTFRSTLYPGGIFNDGFALNWATERQLQNRWPDPVGAGWVIDRVGAGDAQCLDNQMLRQQNPDLLQRIQRHLFFPAVGDPDYPEGGYGLAPFYFVSRISVPTFVGGAWQDEQTGGHWPVMLDRFDPAVPLHIVATNGTHVDSLGPEFLGRMLEFFDFYLAERVPHTDDQTRVFVGILYAGIFGVPSLTLPADRFTGMPYDVAFSAYQSQPRVTVLWENGGREDLAPGAPRPRATSYYGEWPPAETVAQSWYLQPHGALGEDVPALGDEQPSGADFFTYDPHATPRGDFRCPDGDKNPSHCQSAIWRADAVYDWRALPAGKSLSFISEALLSQLTMLGSASADLWVATDLSDVDLQVTLTEVRPDGYERYVQNGWLRASHRALDLKSSTELRPRQTHLEQDAEQLPAGEYVLLRVELFPFGHVFRPGSRIRLSVEAPGGSRPLWTFAALEPEKPSRVWIGHSIAHPSRLVLPVVGNVDVPDSLPACPSLRSQPCRGYIEP